MAFLTSIEILCVFVLPNLVAMPGSLFPDRWYFIPIRIFVPVYLFVVGNFHVTVVATMVVVLALVEFPFLKELRVGRKASAYQTNSKLREMNNLIRIYKGAEILLARTNVIVGFVLFPLQSICTMICVFSAFEVIKHRDDLGIEIVLVLLIWAVVTPLGWAGVLIIGGVVHSEGNKILASWKQFPWRNARERVIMGKFRRSCMPLRIAWGRIFIVRRTSLMVFVRGLSRGIMRCLLSFGAD